MCLRSLTKMVVTHYSYIARVSGHNEMTLKPTPLLRGDGRRPSFFFLYKVGTSDLRLHRTVTHGTNIIVHIVLAVKNFILLLMFFHESSVRNPTTSVTHDIFFNFLLAGVTYLIAVHKLKFTVKPCLNIL